ncbi:unnamed protein product [Calypogeia fissa]
MAGKSRKTAKKGSKGPAGGESSEFGCGPSGSEQSNRSPGAKSDRRGGDSNGFVLNEHSISILPETPGMRIRTEMSIAELILNVRHKNRALSGTFCVEPFIVNCVIRSVLEDEFGYTVRVLITDNVVLTSTFKKSRDLHRYAKGRKVVINEPLYTVGQDGLTVVIVDDCRDVSGKVIVCEPFCKVCDDDEESDDDEYQDVRGKEQAKENGEVKEGKATKEAVLATPAERAALTPSEQADKNRCEGNSLFTKNDFVGAMELYSKCITECLQLLEKSKGHDTSSTIVKEEEEADVKKTLMLAYTNRSETWLRCKNFDNAHSDASKALELDPKHVKSLVRNGKALFELQSYEDSASCFNSALEESPDDQQAQVMKAALARSKAFQEQSRDGIYDLNDYYVSCCTRQPPECSDFVGPVEIQRPEGKMRGLFSTKDIPAGELILVSNAIAVYDDDMRRNHSHSHCHDHDEDQSDSDDDEDDRGCGECDVCEKHKSWAKRKANSKRNSCHVDELTTQVLSFAGTSRRRAFQVVHLQWDEKRSVIPPIDLYRPGINWKPPVEWASPNGETGKLAPPADVVREIVKQSFIDEILNDPRCFTNGEQKRIWSGVWLLPAIMNHSCCANTETWLVGEAMFIRACRDITSGEEVTRSYFDTLKGLERRQDVAKRWPFKCTCERCEWESSIPEPHNKVRKKLCSRVYKFFYEAYAPPFVPNLEKLASLVSEVEETIESVGLEGKFRLWIRASLMDAYIANIHVLVGIPSRRIEAIKTVLEVMVAVGGGLVLRPQIASTLLKEVKRKYGKTSPVFRSSEDYVMEIYKPFYGQLNKKAFLALVRMHAGGDGLD